MRARPANLAAPLAAPAALLVLLGGLTPASAAGGDDEDFVAPEVSVTLPASQSGWYTGDTAFSVGVKDAGGVAAVEYQLSGATTREGSLPGGGGSVPVTTEGSTWLVVTATDRADNTGVGSGVVNIDRTAPSIDFAPGIDGARVPVGAELPYDVTCTDAHSGIESCTGPVADGESLDTSTTGTKTVSVVARDRAGLTTTSTASYEVVTGTFEVTGALRVDGTMTTFSTATAKLPTITPEPTSISYQWHADWGAIPGATGPTYELPADAPMRLSVSVVIERAGYESLTLTSAQRYTYLSNWEESAIHVEGTPKVGSVLTAAVAAKPEPLSTSYAWYVEGVQTGGGPTYQVAPEDAGKNIVAEATIYRPGYHTRYPWTTVGPVEKGTLEVTGTPQVAGVPVVGRVLNAVNPDVPAGASVSHQWLVGGAPVPGATAATFRPRSQDAGRAVAVLTTVSAPGHESWSATSAATAPVARATSQVRTSAKVLGSARDRTRTVRVVAVVRAPGVVPTGRVTITRAGKVVGRGSVNSRGTATITLRRQPAGVIRYVVRYAGDVGVLTASTAVKVPRAPAR